jgi:hypothetical protein
MMWLRRSIIVAACVGTLVAGGAIAFAVTGGRSAARSRWMEVAIHERVVLLLVTQGKNVAQRFVLLEDLRLRFI